jgi:phosphoglycolate phosphatase
VTPADRGIRGDGGTVGGSARWRALVFDLDGTLVDSRADLVVAVNRMRADLGRPELAAEAVVGMVGEGARRLVERALDAAGEALVERALALFLAHYEPICADRTRPYPGIAELLAAEAGRRPLTLLTNKPERMSRRILAAFGWSGLFAAVVGGDTLAERKPAPAGLHHLARRLDLPVEELCLVGDTGIDAATARAAGAGFVWVEWGFAGAADRAELGRGPRAASAAALARRLAEAR